MAEEKIKAQASMSIDYSIQFTLTYEEAKALDALAGYEYKAFLETFYTKMGKHYLEPYEKGLRSLFERIKKDLRYETEAIDQSKKAIENALYGLKIIPTITKK